ncbi:hypothetical protein ACIP6V_31640 [Streptomyces sp. NPDC088770]|uniref:hypothetical protein n=1 Tax=Streptomyces sp. NPDC088770 TaxID=3365895 RepID=UPI00382A0E6C
MRRHNAVAALIACSALLPVTGCARNADQTVVTAPIRSAPGAVPDEKNCPTAADLQDDPVPTSVDATAANDPAAEELSNDSIKEAEWNDPVAEALSQAVGAQRDAFADVYGSHMTDYPPGRVALCVTDLARGQQLAAAAKQADPGIDLSRLDLYRCSYAERTLAAALDKINTADDQERLLGFPLYSSWLPPDASGVVVNTTAQGAASQALRDRLAALTGGIPVTVVNDTSAIPIPA